MPFHELTITSTDSKKLSIQLGNLSSLLEELAVRELPKEQVDYINEQIDQLNNFSGDEKKIISQIRKTKSAILKHLLSSLKLVTKGHYLRIYMSVGMAAFGLPLGVAFSAIIGNFGFIGIGLPIGIGVGLAIGAQLDKKAKAEGRQLNVALVV